jgi:carbon storage regulator
MLVLSRKDNQRIWIGNSIVLTVVKIQGGSVRLGIEAPSEVKVLRDELREPGRSPMDTGPKAIQGP